MPLLNARLYFRIISKNREVYVLKIITLSIAFACSALIALFSLNEFRYDRFHDNAERVFRILSRNTQESYNSNRLSTKIPSAITERLISHPADSIIFSRVKILNGIAITTDRTFREQKIHAADPAINEIFSFEDSDGSPNDPEIKKGSALLSASAARTYFGTTDAAGKKIKISTLSDTVELSVAAVFRDFPNNSHDQFTVFIRYDSTLLQRLSFNPGDHGVYGRSRYTAPAYFEFLLRSPPGYEDFSYSIQPLPEIYFGPRVLGEDSRHGDRYSILILICITGLILFLALSGFINLTTLTLPYRSKELAVKKLAGTSELRLLMNFAKESFAITGTSLVAGIVILLLSNGVIEPLLFIDLPTLLIQGDAWLFSILTILFLIVAIAPLFMTLRFTRASPIRLLSTDTITFPRFKRIITFLQLGISIFLIVTSLVIRRQVNYSLLKEPGRNHEQIVYLPFPEGMTDGGLHDLRSNWKKYNPNVVNVMATSQLPDRIGSKEINSDFYFISVDREFHNFFDLQMTQGNWFRPNTGDSIFVVNEKGYQILQNKNKNVIGIFRDISGQFNRPEKPLKISLAPYYNYNFLCIRILEVDIRKTVRYLSNYFEIPIESISFFNKRFEDWLLYQDRLNTLSEILAIISAVLSCCAVYGLSISLVRDKLKQIAVHKLYGASTVNITRLLVREFIRQMLMAIALFGPITYIFLKEWLSNFVYRTHFNWTDPLFPLAYCTLIITLLCGFQALSLNRSDLTSALKN